MTMPASGQISISQINTELGRSSSAQASLDTAENGGYGAINPYSCKKPSSTNPAALSEWYGYDHNALSAKNRFIYARLAANINLAQPTWDIYYQINYGGWTALATGLARTATTCIQRGTAVTVSDGDYFEVSVRNSNGIAVAYNATSGVGTACPVPSSVYSEATTPFGVTVTACGINVSITVSVNLGAYVVI